MQFVQKSGGKKWFLFLWWILWICLFLYFFSLYSVFKLVSNKEGQHSDTFFHYRLPCCPSGRSLVIFLPHSEQQWTEASEPLHGKQEPGWRMNPYNIWSFGFIFVSGSDSKKLLVFFQNPGRKNEVILFVLSEIATKRHLDTTIWKWMMFLLLIC